MDCKSLLDRMAVAQKVCIYTENEIVCGTVSQIALELPNCILEMEVSRVYLEEDENKQTIIAISLEDCDVD